MALRVVRGSVVEPSGFEQLVGVVARNCRLLLCCMTGGNGFFDSTFGSFLQVILPRIFVFTLQVGHAYCILGAIG